MAELVRSEVVVVGAGPAGIAAACRAAAAGADVVLLDEGQAPGGQIWRGGSRSDLAKGARRWLERLGRSGARTSWRTAVLDADSPDTLLAERQGRPLEIRGRSVILATGARELFLPFPGWTLPGVVGVGAIQALIKSGARFAGMRVVIAGSGPLLLPVAAALARDGARVGRVAEQAPAGAVRRFAMGLWRTPGKLVEALRYRLRFVAATYRCGTWVLAAGGDDRLRRVVLTDGRRSWTEGCDLLCCAYGLVPNIELAQLLGCQVSHRGVVVDDDQRTTVDGVFAAGEATGIGGAELALTEGEIAAAAVGGRPRALARLAPRRARLRAFAAAMERAFEPRRELQRRLEPATTVCRCEDVSWAELEPGWSFRQAKLYTRVGMGPCQGRVCGPALRFLHGWRSGAVRPPLSPCPIGGLGRSMQRSEP